MKTTIINIILGGIIGVICKIIYDKIHERREKKRIEVLINTEMQSNLKNLKKLLRDIKAVENSQVKEHLQHYTLEETADLIIDCCKKDLFDKCVDKIGSVQNSVSFPMVK